MSTAYQTLKAEANSVKWPEHWKTDLTTHDRALLAKKNAPDLFVWILRKCGTELLPRCDLWEIMTIEYYEKDTRGNRFYLYHNGMLKQTTAPAAVNWLLKHAPLGDAMTAACFSEGWTRHQDGGLVHNVSRRRQTTTELYQHIKEKTYPLASGRAAALNWKKWASNQENPQP